MTLCDQDALLAWAQDYWTRKTSTSFTGHERLYHFFSGSKAHLRTRDEIALFAQRQTSFR